VDHFVYVAASGAKEAMLAQAVNANNLANASTIGFRADLIEAQTLYLKGAGEETRAYNIVEGTGTDFREGPIEQTGRDLDLAINGPGWFAVQAREGGEALTRRGDFRVDEFGRMVNGAGEVLLGDAGPVSLPPFSSISIGDDGTVSLIPLGEQPFAQAALDRIKLVNPSLEAISKNQFGELQVQGGLPSLAAGEVKVVSGGLEASNVNGVSAMVQMIELSRQFEQYMKLMKVSEDLDTSSSSLMRLQG
jgi:flagellar basal-body rod protein FlgF